MNSSLQRSLRWLLPGAALAISAVLVLSAVRTFGELDRQRGVFLKSRIASLAGRLETLPLGSSNEVLITELSEQEPALLQVSVLDAPGGPQDPLLPLWTGNELYRMESTIEGDLRIYRAFVPFHSEGGLRLARIDLDESAADFLTTHARHNVWMSVVAGLSATSLALATAWTARRAANAEQRQLELEHLAHIGTLSSVLAHEIRNPLGTVKGFVQLLGERLGGEHRELLEPVESEVSRLENLVRDLLLYGRPPQPAMREISAEQVANTVRAHLRHDKRMKCILHTEPAVFQTDPALLEQALLNVVRNAAEAAEGREAATVSLDIAADGRWVYFRVADNGPGLTTQAMEHLYEPFFTTKSIGTGLGLSITRKLIRALGGEFTIRNQAEGGALAEIRLPLQPA
ncbi:MAG: hypothetical protein JST93_01340 [Acidobacteria bacterium]|nr:hypothetical protein [Acidobacteriota bacterium]